MLKKTMMQGLLMGLLAGLIVTLFDSLFMLTPNIYFPINYPFDLFIVNIFFWMTFGSISGFLLWLYSRNKKNFSEKEKLYWVLFFLLPFALIYGFLGKLDLNKLIAPAFDYHLSFLWVSCILLVSIIFKKKVRFNKTLAIHFIPELIAIAAVYMFCSNMNKISAFMKFFSYCVSAVNYNSKLTLLIYMLYQGTIYGIGLLLIFGLYTVSVKLTGSRTKQLSVIVALFVIVLSAVAAISILNRDTYVKEHLTSTTSESIPPTPGKPNVILIVLDTVRADRLSIYGHTNIQKNLDSFSRDALVFENCIASSSWTLPSHASLFTGLYPLEHGSHQKKQANKGRDGYPPSRPLAKKFITLADRFKNSGYFTAGIVSNYAFLHPRFNINKGFQIYDCTNNIGKIYDFPFCPLLIPFSFITNIKPQYHLPYRPAEDINDNIFFYSISSHKPLFLCS